MRKTLLLLFALLGTMAGLAQTNLTSGKTVVPLGGLKSFLPVGAVTEDNLQKITQDGNTDNVFLFPQNGENLAYNQTLGIQGFYIDLGESKSIGAIQSTWEGADCGANIYVTDTEPAADGSLTGETLIATFDNAQESAKNVAVAVENSGRYIVFVPTVATNFGWGVKIRTFAAFEKEASVLTSFEVSPSTVKVNEETELTLSPKDQLGLVITEGVSYTASSGTLEGNKFTTSEVGDITITASYNGVEKTAIIKAINISAPTENPTEPTDLAANVIAVYSAKYGKGINESNPTWGVGGGAPNPLYASVEEVEIANGHKVVHVKGTGFNSRTAGGVGITNDYSKVYVALYPFSATQAKVFGDNAYAKAQTVDNLVPGQWNYIVLDNEENLPNYMLVELVGETEFYLDHFYAAKPAVEDDEAPVLETAELAAAGIGSLTLKLKATDNKSAQVTYVITDQNNAVYTTKGNSGAEISFAIGDLAFNTEYTLSIIAKDDNENASAAQTVTGTTTALTAAPVPTKDADDVIALFSNPYAGATDWSAGGWGQSTVLSPVAVGEDDILKFSNFNYFGFDGFSNQIDLSGMDYLHIDIMPTQAMEFGITPIMTGGVTEKSTSVGALTAGEWNSIDLPLADFGFDFSYKMFQLKIDRGTGVETVYVDNIYFWKDASAVVDTEAPVITKAEATTVSDKKATLTLSATDNSDGNVTFTVLNGTEQVGAATVKSGEEATVEITSLTPETAYTLSVVAKDKSGNESTAQEVTFTTTEEVVEPTSGEGTYTIPAGLNAGKELAYTWAFTQTGSDVTVTFACKNATDIIGIVDGYVFDYSDGFAEHEGLSYTWTGCTEGQVITAAHKWMFAEGDFVTPQFTYTVLDPTTTGISSLNVNNRIEAGNIYDLQGRKMSANGKLPKGIYIINGSKFVIK